MAGRGGLPRICSTLQRQSVVDHAPTVLSAGFQTASEPLNGGISIVIYLDRRAVFAGIHTADRSTGRGCLDAQERDHVIFLHYGSSDGDIFELVVKLIELREFFVKIVVEIKIALYIKIFTHMPLLQTTLSVIKVQFIFHFGVILNEHFFGNAVAGPAVDQLSPDLIFAKVLAIFP